MAKVPLAAMLLIVWSLSTPAFAQTASGLSLTASAGLGGVTRPGSWTPVSVTIANTAGAIDCELIAQWGHAEVRQRAHIASPSTRQIELMMRTSDVAERIRVRFVSDGHEIAATEAPIRIARPDDPFVLCVHTLDISRCAAAIDPAGLPHSWRGYDAVDALEWPGENRGDRALLAADQQDALLAWETIHPIAIAGHLASPPVDPEPSGAPRVRNAWFLAVYLGSIIAVALAWRRRAGLLERRVLVLCVVVCAGSAVALAAGRLGPGSSVLLTHDTVVDAFADVPDALVSVRAVAEFPAFDSFALRPALSDAWIDRGDGDAIQPRDENGSPALAGTFGLGTRQTFSVNGLARLTLLRMTSIDHALRVTNESDTTLDACVLEDASGTPRPMPRLDPGGHVDLPLADIHAPATVSCTAPGSIITFADPRYRIDSRGHVRVVLHLESSREGGGP